jgi:hypothetical protein
VEEGSCSPEYSFTLTNTGGGTATGSASLTGTHASQFTITQGSGSFSLGAGASKTIKVKFCPTSTGSKSANLFADGSNCNDDSSSLSGTGVENPELSYSPTSHDFGNKHEGENDSTSFEIWNCGTGTLDYSLSESCGWVDVHPTSGSSIGEHDPITVDIDTTGLSEGSHTCYISISSNDGSGIFTVTVNIITETTPPLVTDPSANPSVIPDDTDDDPRWGETSVLNVTVTDESNIESVTIDLSAIGGSAVQPMTNIVGDIWSVETNATEGTAPGTYDLLINATDEYGNSNTTESISLRVQKNGDVQPYNGDGTVDFMHDGLYLVRHTLNVPGYVDIRDNIADVTGDGTIDFVHDGLYLVRHTLNVPGYEILH